MTASEHPALTPDQRARLERIEAIQAEPPIRSGLSWALVEAASDPAALGDGPDADLLRAKAEITAALVQDRSLLAREARERDWERAAANARYAPSPSPAAPASTSTASAAPRTTAPAATPAPPRPLLNRLRARVRQLRQRHL
jgi:hypothetical protein